MPEEMTVYDKKRKIKEKEISKEERNIKNKTKWGIRKKNRK